MTIRAVVLFTHVVGMLVLFIGIAFEWLSTRIASTLHDIGARIVMGEAARSAAARVRRRIRGAPRVGHLSGETGAWLLFFSFSGRHSTSHWSSSSRGTFSPSR